MIIEVKTLVSILGIEEYNQDHVQLKINSLESMIKAVTHNDFHQYRDNQGVIQYPSDVIMGVVNLYKWDEENRDRIGVKSEAIGRHNVTYDESSSQTIGGYPKQLMTFLTPYMKARF